MRVATLLLLALLPVGTPWDWPVEPARIAAPYVAPAHAYGPGHRGLDLHAEGRIRAPADGVVAFAGTVVDRGVLTIDHGDGRVLTLEPVEPLVAAGDVVRRGQEVATLGSGGHAALGTLHVGVRVEGEYVNPMLLFGTVPRAVLLPCC
jgi:murein DD-endopeptidase MepM/ murein hydrolase activator NlpD